MTKILLAEDNEMNREVLTRRLVKRGYDVIEAVNGEGAVEQAKEHVPALILMDLSMPVMDGWEATRMLRDDPDTADIPIVALTAHAIRSERERALEAGCDGVLTKPFTTDELFATVDEFLQP